MIQPPTLHKQTRVVMTSTEILFLFFPLVLSSPSRYHAAGHAVGAPSGAQIQFQASFQVDNVTQQAFQNSPWFSLPPEWAMVKLQFSNNFKHGLNSIPGSASLKLALTH